MKVVLVTGIYPPDHGGPARFVPQLAEACHERGWSVEVITLSENDVAADEAPWTVTRIPRNIPKWRRLPLTAWRIMVASRGSDVLFVNGLFEEASIASALSRTPWVAKFVGDPVWERYRNSVPEPVSLEDFPSIKISPSLRYRRTSTVRALRRAFCVITPSEQLASLLATWDVSDVRYVPNGVELTPLSDVPPMVDVLCVARMVPWKHIDVLIDACAKESLSLWIVGDGPEHEALILQAEQLVPSAPIKFLGAVDPQEIAGVIDQTRIFALLSSYEGMSFALLEAMSRGKPVVVGDNPGNRAVVQDGFNGLIVTHDDVDQVGNALRRLVDDQSLASTISGHARDTIESSFSVANTLDRTIQTLEQAAQGDPR